MVDTRPSNRLEPQPPESPDTPGWFTQSLGLGGEPAVDIGGGELTKLAPPRSGIDGVGDGVAGGRDGEAVLVVADGQDAHHD
jgi:hypothetical protein